MEIPPITFLNCAQIPKLTPGTTHQILEQTSQQLCKEYTRLYNDKYQIRNAKSVIRTYSEKNTASKINIHIYQIGSQFRPDRDLVLETLDTFNKKMLKEGFKATLKASPTKTKLKILNSKILKIEIADMVDVHLQIKQIY
jgi:archaellum component FlaF (FlaF/FlaG flagellin family)